MTHDEMIAVLTHHKNGGNVQCRSHHGNTWHDFYDELQPSWHFSTCDYRAKPEPLVLWIVTDSCNKVIYADQSMPLSADFSAKSRKFVEVTE